MDRLLSLPALLFAVPVFGGIGLTLFRLVTNPFPEAEFASTVGDDAAALYLGEPLYQDPADGYSGILYTPGFPALVSVLYRLSVWSGWPPLVTVLATLVLAGLAGRLSWRPAARSGRGARALAAAEAVGVAALAWLLGTCIDVSGVYEGNGQHDQLAWALAISGLVLLPRAMEERATAALLASTLLLWAAVWTKQVALTASVAAALWLALAAGVRAVAPRRALGFLIALAGLNLATVGALNLLTSGWQLELNVLVPGAHALDQGSAPFPANLRKVLEEDLLPVTALAIGFAGAVWGAVALARSFDRSRRREPRSRGTLVRELVRPGVLWVPALAGAITALLFRRAGSLDFYFLTAPDDRLRRFVDGVAFPLSVVAVVVGLCLVTAVGFFRARTRSSVHRAGGETPDRPLIPASRAGRVAGVLLAAIAVGVPVAAATRPKLGADDNYYVGIAWALVLLGGLGYGAARSLPGARWAASGAVLALFLAVLVVKPVPQSEKAGSVNLPTFTRVGPGPGQGDHEQWLTVVFPRQGLLPVRDWTELDPALRRYAREHMVYVPGYGALNLSPQGLLWPSYDNLIGNLAAGRPVGFLLDAWLDRRFDAVNYPLDAEPLRAEFTSGAGAYEENILWKLNRVLDARYRPADPALPAGLAERRPGPERDRWMRGCFGPFPLAGASFRINTGGGFWCREEGALTLRETPAAYSDVRTVEPVRTARGRLGAALRGRRGFFELVVEPPEGGGERWRLRGQPGRRGATALTLLRGEEAVRRVALRGSGVEIDLGALLGRRTELTRAGPGVARLELPVAEAGAVVRLGASRGSGARFDLRRVVLE